MRRPRVALPIDSDEIELRMDFAAFDPPSRQPQQAEKKEPARVNAWHYASKIIMHGVGLAGAPLIHRTARCHT